MNDIHEKYVERVEKGLSRREGDSMQASAEALCFPSFAPEVLLRATKSPAGTLFRLATFTINLWFSCDDQVSRVQEVKQVEPVRAESFWQSMEEINPDQIANGENFGADGMSVRATFQKGDSTHSFQAWSPDLASGPGKFVHLLYCLAWELLADQTSIERLEQLHGYMNLGLPARFIPGKLRTLRLFGSLTSNDREALRKVFVSVSDGLPLVIDMTNFVSMGTLLYPIFVEFAKKQTHLAWACAEHAKRHLKDMRLDESRIFGSVEDAISFLGRQ